VPKMTVKGQTVQTGEHPQTNGRTHTHTRTLPNVLSPLLRVDNNSPATTSTASAPALIITSTMSTRFPNAIQLVFLHRIRDHRLPRAGSPYRTQVTYPAMCSCPLFVAPSDHDPPTSRTDRRTDGRHSRSHMIGMSL